MHTSEIILTDSQVRDLIDRQFPHWAHLPLSRLASGGTSNALYRLGDDKVVRLPLIDWAAGDAAREARYLPMLAPHLPLPVPVPLALGVPDQGYPFSWSVVPWLPGADALSRPPADLSAVARDMAGFIAALRAVPIADGPAPAEGNRRGGPLAPRDAEVQKALSQLDGEIDIAAAARSWSQSLAAPEWTGPPVWLHADLHPGNLLVADGRVSGVIDWGALAVGDPATELLFAWMVLDAPARAVFRDALAVDEASWLRGRGWALSMGLIALPYYLDSNPALVRIARRGIAEALADSDT